MVIGVDIKKDKLDNLKGTSQKMSRLVLLNLMVEWILILSLIGQLLLSNILIGMK